MFFGQLWTEQEKYAILFGIDLDKYWEMHPVVFQKYAQVHEEKEKARAIETDMHNYNLGKYIAFAVNEPKKYPRKPFLEGKMEMKEEKKTMTAEEMEWTMKKNTYILGGTVK